MLELNKLTRCFHDQCLTNLICDNNTIAIYIEAFETGELYGYTNSFEYNDIDFSKEEKLRKIQIVFYDAQLITKDFTVIPDDGLTIYDITNNNGIVSFELYDDYSNDDKVLYLTFSTTGFEFNYIED